MKFLTSLVTILALSGCSVKDPGKICVDPVTSSAITDIVFKATSKESMFNPIDFNITQNLGRLITVDKTSGLITCKSQLSVYSGKEVLDKYHITFSIQKTADTGENVYEITEGSEQLVHDIVTKSRSIQYDRLKQNSGGDFYGLDLYRSWGPADYDTVSNLMIVDAEATAVDTKHPNSTQDPGIDIFEGREIHVFEDNNFYYVVDGDNGMFYFKQFAKPKFFG